MANSTRGPFWPLRVALPQVRDVIAISDEIELPGEAEHPVYAERRKTPVETVTISFIQLDSDSFEIGLQGAQTRRSLAFNCYPPESVDIHNDVARVVCDGNIQIALMEE